MQDWQFVLLDWHVVQIELQFEQVEMFKYFPGGQD